MFEALRKKLAQAAGEDEEITFKSFDEKKAEPEVVEQEKASVSQSSSNEGSNIELKVVRPESMNEIFTIADYLLDGCTVVLNLEILDRDSITRMLDFLNGVTYTTGGEVKNVSPGTYIITPSGINIDK
ncbi:MAG: cell division protein SepF [Clostridia bacterium]|nr:cell division protein SepF [Clostridia bacterium]